MVQRTVKEKVIAGTRYKVTLLGAKQGRGMLVRLVKLLGPATAAFVEGTLHAKGGLTASVATGAADAIREITTRITEAEFASLSDELAKYTAVCIDNEHEPQLDRIFEEHFVGRYDVLLQWFAFSLEANFSSFLGGYGSADSKTLAQRLQTLIASLSISPTESTGTSTESPPASTTAQA